MRCSSCEPLLDAYLEGMLPARKARLVNAHLRACKECSALLEELRIVDALLATAHPPAMAPGFTAAVVSATSAAQPAAPRRIPIWIAFILYLGAAWALVAVAVRSHELARLAGALLDGSHRDLAAFDAAVRAVAPATPLAAAAVTGVLLIDLLLFCAIFYGYRRLRLRIAPYLAREPRS
jgi:anti-sigma factor RsiW